MTFRKQQIESVLKRAITELMLRKISDPRIVGMVSITRVDVSPDLSQATVHVSVLPVEHEKTTVAGLNHAASYIHGLVRKSVTFRTVPHLNFRLDHDIKKESSILEAIGRGVAREKRRVDETAGEEEGREDNSSDQAAAQESAGDSARQAGRPSRRRQSGTSDSSGTTEQE